MPMGWVAAAGAIAGLAGGAMQSDAAKSGAGQQSSAANNATAAQLGMFNTINAQGQPYRTAGGGALAMLSSGAGIPLAAKPGYDFSGAQRDSGAGYWDRPGGGASNDFWVPSGSPTQLSDLNPGQQGGFSDWVSAHQGNQASISGGDINIPQGGDATAYIPQYLHDTNQMPAGQTMTNAGMMPPDSFTKQFTSPDMYLSPSYQFMLSQGLGQTGNFMNSRGGFNSGNTLKGLTDYAIGAAGQGYGQAYDIFSSQQTNIFNRLADIAGLGQTANAQSAGAGASISPGIANSMMASGTAQGGGTVGSANALAGGINNAGSWYALSKMMDPGGVGPG